MYKKRFNLKFKKIYFYAIILALTPPSKNQTWEIKINLVDNNPNHEFILNFIENSNRPNAIYIIYIIILLFMLLIY